MARRPAATQFQHSLWDRLTNPDLIRGERVLVDASSELTRFREEVRRDLEWLLNSRRAPLNIPKGMTHLNPSVVTFGLPDFTGKSFSQTQEREELVALIENLVRDFEPRLTDVCVTFNRLDVRKAQAALHYRIEALLRVDPAPEPVAYDTVLEVGDRAFSVTSHGG